MSDRPTEREQLLGEIITLAIYLSIYICVCEPLGAVVFTLTSHQALLLLLLLHLSRQDLSHNRFRRLPDSLGRLTQLRRLHVSNNALEALPATVGALEALEELEIYHNRLTALPQQIQTLSRVTRLDLRYNRLTGLPMLRRMAALRELHVGYNALAALGDIGACLPAALTVLDLRDNKLRALPDSIVALTALERLELSNNDLAELPPQLGTLPRLKALGLEGNPLRALRAGILSRGTQGILKYLR